MRQIKLLVLIAIAFIILACDLGLSQTASVTKPTVAIGSPPHGAEFRVGQEVLVQVNASDARGIARIELWVDNVLVTTAQPPTPQSQFSTVLQWMAAPGTHILAVKAVNSAGTTSDPASVAISVLAPITPTQVLVPPTALPTKPPTVPPIVSAAPTQIPMPPTAPPTQTPSVPTFSAITFSSAFDANSWTPINPGKVFPYGTKIIYAYWTYGGIMPNTEFEYEWLFNNAHIDGDTDRFPESSGKSAQWLVHPRSEAFPLDRGNYEFIVRVGGRIVLSDAFVIQ